MVVNLRGVKDTGAAFILPTFLFIGTLLSVIVVGLVRTYMAPGHHPVPMAKMPLNIPPVVQYLGWCCC